MIVKPKGDKFGTLRQGQSVLRTGYTALYVPLMVKVFWL